MFLLTTVLVALLLIGLFVAARELVGFTPEAEWGDGEKLRERLASPLPHAPHHKMATRSDMVRFCLELRREFRSAWRLCRFLAPISGDPAYVGTLMMSKIRFTAVLGLAVLSAAVGAGQACENLSEQLRELGDAMRESAMTILGAAEAQHGMSGA